MQTQGRGMTILSYRQSIGPFKWTTLLMPISIIAIATLVMGYCCPRNLKPILNAWQTSSWSIFLVSMFCTVGWDYWTRAGRHRAMLPYKSRHLYPNEVLIYHGYIGCSSLHPTVAVSLRTLSTYHQVHRICPQFGIQAQCKLLCYLHDVCLRSVIGIHVKLMTTDAILAVSERSTYCCLWHVPQYPGLSEWLIEKSTWL